MTINFSDKTTPPENSPTSGGDIEISDLIDQELISKLDSIKSSGNLYKKYSEIYSGGVYTVNEKNRTENPDWMSQSANSFREIFYVLQNNETKALQNILGDYLKKSLTDKEVEKYKEYLNNLYSLFTDLTHHFSSITNLDQQIYSINESLVFKASELDQDKYFKAIGLYKEYLKLLVTTAVEMHQKIDKCIKENKKDKELVKIFLNNSYDSKIYFFSRVDGSWLHWLWTEGFLVALKKPAEDPTKYPYRMPELEYLTRMSEKDPAEVVKIIDSIKISEANLNPEVIIRFLWIISTLPAEQIKTLTSKIRDERWVYLMRDFRKNGYEFEKIVRKLVEAKESNAILELSQAIFSAKSKVEISRKESGLGIDDPFYVSDLNASGIFEALADIEKSYSEKALEVASSTMSEIVKLAKPDDTKVFEYMDSFPLFDVDFFTLEIKDDQSISYREDIKNLAATIKKLIERSIGQKCGDTNEALRLINYVNKLPSSRSMWRLRLFALAQCPETFKEELRKDFFKLFEVENYYEIVGGTEYKKTLRIAFPHLSEPDQRTYVAKVLQYFSEKTKQNPGQDWHKQTGREILSSICNYLQDDESQKCEEIFGMKCDEKYEPKPSMSEIRGGAIIHRSPVNLADYTIEQIVANLKSGWTPEKLKEQFKDDDFLSPRGVEGLGDALKEDIKKRIDDYLKNINNFFDRNTIHPHYLYSLLRGIEEMLRNKQSLKLEQTGQILGLFEMIKNEWKKTPFKKEEDKSWLADWIAVHKVITDILLHVLESKEIKEEVHKTYREEIKNLISYLFTIKDSPSKEDEKPEYGEPYHVAINSVRGRAYEAFVVFTENDGQTLAGDTKKLFRAAFSDNSLAVRFVIGRYLASFYFRDKEFITMLFPEIFPKDDPEKKDIYLATWEGYLSNTLYDKLFVALKDYYEHAITLDPKYYTERKYSSGLDKSLATHIALAFAHLELEMSDSLFTKFWSRPNITRHQEFISFIGRSCLTRDQAGDEWLKENKVSKEKLINFWNWAVVNVAEPEALSGFGFWVNPDKEILDDKIVVEKMAETLKKSDGDIDWDYGLLKRLPIFAEKNGDKTLEIISSYLLDSKNNLNQNRRTFFLYDTEIKEALKIIYNNGGKMMKQNVANLINTLIEKGNSAFWNLEEVISKN